MTRIAATGKIKPAPVTLPPSVMPKMGSSHNEMNPPSVKTSPWAKLMSSTMP